MLEPHVSAIMDCMRALPSDDIAVRIQVPPVITPLRGILEHVLHGSATADDWASLVAVAEALEALCVGTDLVHPADVLSLERGGGRHQPHRQTRGPCTTAGATGGRGRRLACRAATSATGSGHATRAGDFEKNSRMSDSRGGRQNGTMAWGTTRA